MESAQSTSTPTTPAPIRPNARGGQTLKKRTYDAKRRAQITELKLNWLDRIIFYAMLSVFHLLSLIPDFLLYRLGMLGGLIAYKLDRRHVRIGMRNLAIAFPERSIEERQRILRSSYLNIGRSVAEYIRLGGFFYERLKKRVSYHRFDYWLQLQQQHAGKGGLVLTAHFGNFELLLAAHAMNGQQISLVHHTQRFLPGDALMSFIRERAGVTIIRKHAAARAVLKALRENKIIGIPFDQNAKRSEAVFVPFFNEIAATSTGLARLVAITGAPVIPVFIVRQPDNRSHVIEIFDEVPIQRSGDAAADIEVNTRCFVKAIEDIVRRHPEQFLWMHRRYKTRPVRGTPSFYED
ncbi:MAG TPA: lysophospholipid acyltransferase family protein [Candidatus Binataceae bacterium]|nr:lysophospholipid acyltransferase family protein [Candidatus Binataceae bacterium]